MATDVDIGNMALSKLGTRATIADLTENSTEARQINLWYATVRDDLQSLLDWNYNRVTQALAASGTPPARWAASYAYPSDCLKIWRIDFGGTCWNYGDPVIPFEIASDGTNQLLLCNDTATEVVFAQRVSDSARFTPSFILAFVDCLAAAVALPITQKLDLAMRLQGIAQGHVEKAMAASANEQATNQSTPMAESLRVRGFDDLGWLRSGPAF